MQSSPGSAGIAGGVAEGEGVASQTPALDEHPKEPTPAIKVLYCNGEYLVIHTINFFFRHFV